MKLLDFKREMLQKEQKNKFKKIADFLFKLQYKGKGLPNDFNVWEKFKLTRDDLYYFIIQK